MPNVSIIMGVYNCKNEELLKKSIESIINQTYTDWEFIICDDGSTDDTLKKIKKYEEIDSRIRVISYSKNRGLNYALNKCLEVAKGTYIARQDDDDISYSKRLEKEVSYLNKNPDIAIVGTIADIYDDKGKWGVFNVDEEPKKSSFYWNSPFIHPTVMIRKNALEVVDNYRVCKETRRCEDYDLFMRMYAQGFKGYNIQEKLYCYRMVNDPSIKYRPMKYRLDEAIVRFKGYKNLGILFPRGIAYVVKPIIIGLIPQSILYKIKDSQY